MTNPRTWLLLVDHKHQTWGERFLVRHSKKANIYDLKKKVKEKRPQALSCSLADPSDLTVWRCTDPTTVFNFRDAKILERQVSEVFSSKKVEQLDSIWKVVELSLLEEETLVVVVPGQTLRRISTVIGGVLIQAVDFTLNPHGHSITFEVEEYKDCFVQAHTKGKFTENDIKLNHIEEARQKVPKFIQDCEEMLGRKRKMPQDVRCFVILSSLRLLTGDVSCAQ